MYRVAQERDLLEGSLLLGCRLASQLGQLALLVGRQFVLDAHEQGHLLALNFAFRGHHFFQLGENLLLVDARLLDQRNQLLHFILQFPLQLREFQLRGADFRLEIIFLLGA